MTLHLKRINGFGNGNGGGGGGGDVTVLETIENAFEQKKQTGFTGGFGFQLNNSLFLDNTQLIYWVAPYQGGTKGIAITKIIKYISYGYIDGTESSFTALDFGQTYMSSGSINMRRYSSVSPDKTKLIVVHYGQAKISLIPITKSGDKYSLGAATTFDVAEFTSANQISFIDNNRFLVQSTPNIYCYEIENNTITLKATFTNTEAITGFLNIGETIMITNSSTRKVWFLDNITDQNIIYTETLTENFETISTTNSNCFTVDNKFFLHLTQTTSLPFKCFYIDNGQITSVVLTGQTNSTNNSFGSCVVYDSNNNKVSILIASSTKIFPSYSWITSIEIDFTLSTIRDNAIVPASQNSYYWSNYGAGILYFDNTDVFLRLAYQSNTQWFYFVYTKEHIDYKISYNGWNYTATDKVSS